MEAVERPLRRVHLGVVLPRLGDHHQHGVVERPPAEVEQLERLVEARRVRSTWRADRERPRQPGEQRAGEHRLPRPHRVLVALHRVDLAVVGDEAVRVGERPRRERVRREAAVHEGEGALEALVGEVGIERRQLRGRQHPLVHERPRRQRWEVGGDLVLELVLDALAHDEGLAVEVDAGRSGRVRDDELAERRHHRPRRDAEAVGAHRDVAPGHHGEAFVLDDALDRRLRLLAIERVDRQEGESDGVVPDRRQVVTELAAQEAIGDLHEHAGAVAGVGFGSGCSAVVEVAQRPKCRVDDAATGDALEVGDEGHAARVVLEARVVEAVTLWSTGDVLHSVVVLVHESRRSAWVVPGTTLARTVNRQSRGSAAAHAVSFRHLGVRGLRRSGRRRLDCAVAPLGPAGRQGDLGNSTGPVGGERRGAASIRCPPRAVAAARLDAAARPTVELARVDARLGGGCDDVADSHCCAASTPAAGVFTAQTPLLSSSKTSAGARRRRSRRRLRAIGRHASSVARRSGSPH